MRILITGNMGYVGPAVVCRLRESYPDATLMGFDMGYFIHCLTAPDIFAECRVDMQYVGDVRKFPDEVLRKVDAMVHLAAISNDPMGASFQDVTFETNHRASVHLARKAKEAGVRSFVFASSCSVYGQSEGGARTENDPVNPLTAYAKSKIMAEHDLSEIADETFTVTCLRFATACGMSDRLRLDLVLNDFVASAIACGTITILSDGTPWRPLIHIQDMARAIDWAIQRDGQGGTFLTINVGSDQCNYQVRELAEAVASVVSNVKVSVNEHAQPDKRSYRVNFDCFTQLAAGYLPKMDLVAAVHDLARGLSSNGFRDQAFRNSRYMRLNVLEELRTAGLLTDDLRWVHWTEPTSLSPLVV